MHEWLPSTGWSLMRCINHIWEHRLAAKEKKKRILFQKFIYTVGIVLVYILGRYLPIYGIDTSAYRNRTWDAQALLLQTVTGDRNQSSVFALGISPYMIASMIVMVIVACRST